MQKQGKPRLRGPIWWYRRVPTRHTHSAACIPHPAFSQIRVSPWHEHCTHQQVSRLISSASLLAVRVITNSRWLGIYAIGSTIRLIRQGGPGSMRSIVEIRSGRTRPDIETSAPPPARQCFPCPWAPLPRPMTVINWRTCRKTCRISPLQRSLNTEICSPAMPGPRIYRAKANFNKVEINSKCSTVPIPCTTYQLHTRYACSAHTNLQYPERSCVSPAGKDRVGSPVVGLLLLPLCVKHIKALLEEGSGLPRGASASPPS